MGLLLLMAVTIGLQCVQAASKMEISSVADGEAKSLVSFYTQLHANPELSLREAVTSELIAKELESAGFTVTRNVGGHGFVGILKNGAGPVVMVRTDLDALPVTE